MNKTIGHLAIYAAAVAAGLWVGFEVGDRRIPSVVLSKTPIVKDVTAGSDAAAKYVFIRNRACLTRATRQLIASDGERYPLPPLEFREGQLPVDESDTSVLHFTVPTRASLGKLTYCTYNTFACTWVQDKFWPIIGPPRCVDFNVVNSDHQ